MKNHFEPGHVKAAFLATALAWAASGLSGCDRLRRATVEGRSLHTIDSPCGRLNLETEVFIDSHYFLEVENASGDSLTFRVRTLRAWDGGKPLEYRVKREGKAFGGDSLVLAPKERFTFDILTGIPAVTVSAESLFTAGSGYCDLDTLLLKVEE